MFGKLTFHKDSPVKPHQVTGTQEYSIEFREEFDRSKVKIVNCIATTWKIGNQKFLVSKFSMSATGTLSLTIMGLAPEPVKEVDARNIINYES